MAEVFNAELVRNILAGVGIFVGIKIAAFVASILWDGIRERVRREL